MEGREELEIDYAERPDKTQSRLRFFIDLARSEVRKQQFKQGLTYNPQRKAHLAELIRQIRVLGNDAIKHYKVCHQYKDVFIYERDGQYL